MNEMTICPYCGFAEIVRHPDNTITCARCLKRYNIRLYKEKDLVYEQENWLPVKDYENLYEVSNYMRVRRVSHYTHGRHIYGRILTPYLKKKKYMYHYIKMENVRNIMSDPYIDNQYRKRKQPRKYIIRTEKWER